MKKAILFGATGFVGSNLLNVLLASADYQQVIIVVRKETGIQHPKLVTLIGDFNSLPSLSNQLVGDELFIALGTTKANTPDQNEYYQIDHDYPVAAAAIAKANQVGFHRYGGWSKSGIQDILYQDEGGN